MFQTWRASRSWGVGYFIFVKELVAYAVAHWHLRPLLRAAHSPVESLAVRILRIAEIDGGHSFKALPHSDNQHQMFTLRVVAPGEFSRAIDCGAFGSFNFHCYDGTIVLAGPHFMGQNSDNQT